MGNADRASVSDPTGQSRFARKFALAKSPSLCYTVWAMETCTRSLADKVFDSDSKDRGFKSRRVRHHPYQFLIQSWWGIFYLFGAKALGQRDIRIISAKWSIYALWRPACISMRSGSFSSLDPMRPACGRLARGTFWRMAFAMVRRGRRRGRRGRFCRLCWCAGC